MVFAYNKNKEGMYICTDNCNFITHNQSTMHYHMKVKHNGTLEHECKECNMKFPQKSQLNLHVKSRHSNDNKPKKEYNCPCCDYKDLRKGNCIIHFTRIHLKDITDKLKTKSTDTTMAAHCSQCSKSFKSMTLYYYHVSSCIRLTDEHPLKNEWTELLA